MTKALKITLKEKDKRFHSLVVNGVADKRSSVFTNQKGLLFATIRDERVWKLLASSRVQDLAQHFGSFGTTFDAGWEGWDGIEIQLTSYQGKKERRIEFKLHPDSEHWAKPYTLVEYAEAFEKAVKIQDLAGVRYYVADEIISNGFGIRCKMRANDPVVSDELDRCAVILASVREKAEELLSATARKNAVTSFFSFPPEVKTACEQYLVYFVQFLEDLGIKAEVELKEDARRVLFTVTPTDGPSALEKVRQALDFYLKLPSMPNFEAQAGQYSDLAVQQLQANVFHLQSQLMLAKACNQTQEATIEALLLSNFQYRQLISADQKQKSQGEPLIGDTIHVTKLEGKGISIDLPLMLKRLKRGVKRVFGVGKEIDV